MRKLMGSSSSYNTPCAACKFLRRKCMPDCIFAPYFPPEEPQKFANVHKIFGASNVTKLLSELLPHQREDAVNSMAYEAEARVRDPVYGCVGAISYLQRQVQRLQKELYAINADLLNYACSEIHQTAERATAPSLPLGGSSLVRSVAPPQGGPLPSVDLCSGSNVSNEVGGGGGGGGGGEGGDFYHFTGLPLHVYPLPWNGDSSRNSLITINEGGNGKYVSNGEKGHPI
ncbi:hypothetical protein Nepgr_025259 [Nepenthes gracilis]|uniref:LOB domain-containing protein n=1 Tax=Nepenthes gracilis TaxID=150966 RepID=A0AAD3Y1A8_NEPGR|nr:hypothetical protein Nepgr_025259 [Nepenthes gracilis]